MNTELNFGKVTPDELIAAFKTITEVLTFINENRNSEDESVKMAARAALMAVTLNDMATRPVISMIVHEEAKSLGIAKEVEEEESETSQTFKIPIRPAADKS